MVVSYYNDMLILQNHKKKKLKSFIFIFVGIVLRWSFLTFVNVVYYLAS